MDVRSRMCPMQLPTLLNHAPLCFRWKTVHVKHLCVMECCTPPNDANQHFCVAFDLCLELIRNARTPVHTSYCRPQVVSEAGRFRSKWIEKAMMLLCKKGEKPASCEKC
ncbi:unnamed protein product [Dicrocoelium dendriticum]|nr:unnamed protein product [Dicrocoelium dendriticum]